MEKYQKYIVKQKKGWNYMVCEHLSKVKNIKNNTTYSLRLHAKLVKYKNLRSLLHLSREEGSSTWKIFCLKLDWDRQKSISLFSLLFFNLTCLIKIFKAPIYIYIYVQKLYYLLITEKITIHSDSMIRGIRGNLSMSKVCSTTPNSDYSFWYHLP